MELAILLLVIEDGSEVLNRGLYISVIHKDTSYLDSPNLKAFGLSSSFKHHLVVSATITIIKV